MKLLPPSGRWPGLACAICFILTASPRIANAHGELHIQIANVTKQIEATTNNLAPLFLKRAELHREDQTYDDAWADYDRAEKLDPNLPDIDFGRARTLAAQGKLEAAHDRFDLVLHRSPTHAKALIERARLLVRLNKNQPAVADYRKGLTLDTTPEPEAFLELSHVLLAEKKPDEALRALDDGIKKFGPIVLLQSEAIDLELKATRTDAALARIDTLIQREPRKEHWYARRGDVLLAAGRKEEARKAYFLALGSIKLLPIRLQLNPPMQSLQAEINASLARITNTTAVK